MKQGVFNIIAIGISVAGSVIIIYGTLLTLFRFIKTEMRFLHDATAVVVRQERNRSRLSAYLLLGLDFMLAADIIHTIHDPSLNELYVLGLIVAIRSVISFFLMKEIKESVSIHAS
ncbi:DUF1622 domain-containing protein [Pontibacter sp. SGAir0037]|uniref:DUF1622 domain-containing protein n=1 Tax=Pontibacter sp. SGAir0037 TaxID=2571030 RepID=UPI0010CD5EAD|nr:DUF1622 domain-containing protein [Pontibacter sp. SGAir0037]QCR25317.1 hypothetical protein C1N53_22640 [Pontibacter sp. SGAir0037]